MALGDWCPLPGESALDHVATALGSDGFTPKEARRKALRVLDRVELGAARRQAPAASLSVSERARLALARALVREPRLLVVDEPAVMPSLDERERFCELLRRVCHERSVALLAASAELAALQGMQLMWISAGELCCTAQSAQDNVVRLPFGSALLKRPAP
jgi:ABC-type ATPase involved in cell division